jgi:hypothetical protein
MEGLEVCGLQPRFFEEFFKSLLFGCCPGFEKSGDAVPEATVVARAAASSEQGNPAAPLNDGGDDNVVQGDVAGGTRGSAEAGGCSYGAHVLSFATALEGHSPLLHGQGSGFRYTTCRKGPCS